MNEQPTDQTTPSRPTPEQATDARFYFARPEILAVALDAIRHELGEKGVRHFETILAAVEPPTDEAIADFALAYYEAHNLGALAIRTRDKLLSLAQDGPSYRVSAMLAIIRHFLGPVKP